MTHLCMDTMSRPGHPALSMSLSQSRLAVGSTTASLLLAELTILLGCALLPNGEMDQRWTP